MATFYVYPRDSQAIVINADHLRDTLETATRLSAGLAGRYRDLGYNYHKLPFVVRTSGVVEPGWQLYCRNAFVVTEYAELPSVLQLFGTLQHVIGACQAKFTLGDIVAAHRHMVLASSLLAEAEQHVQQLSRTIGRFENHLEYLQLYVWQPNPARPGIRVGMSRNKREMYSRFMDALPAICQPHR